MHAIYAARRADLVDYASSITGDRARAEDILQEAWLRYDGFARRETVKEPAALLFRIVRNLALDRLRRQAQENRHFATGIDEARIERLSDDRASPEEQLLAADELRRLEAALDELDDRTRLAVELHRLEGAKLREIAERLDVSVTTAHDLVARGLRHCRRRLRRDQ